jgi:protein-tyrosine phosphatase
MGPRYRGIKLVIRRGGPAPEPDGGSDWSRFRRQVLLVCHANLCRSPFAAARLAELLPADTWRVFSAGVDTEEGRPVTTRSLRVAAEFGLDLTDHRSHALDPDQVRFSGLIFTMSRRQAEYVARFERGTAARIRLLGAFAPAPNLWGMAADPSGKTADEEEISDPMGQSSELHRQCFERIDEAVARLADWMLRGAVPAAAPATADQWPAGGEAMARSARLRRI